MSDNRLSFILDLKICVQTVKVNQHNYNYHTYGSYMPHLRLVNTILTVIKCHSYFYGLPFFCSL